MRIWWLSAALLLCVALLALEWWAIEDFLFWRYDWFDVLMHFLGGLSLGVLAVGFLYAFRPRLFFVLLAGAFIAWEIFEYVFGLPREADYLLDTMADLIMDTLGASLAYVIALKTLWKKK